MIVEVRLSRGAEKDLRRAPRHIVRALRVSVEAVQLEGLENVRKRCGYHDEPLRGKRAGQRSIRLNRGWRALYRVDEEERGSVAVEFAHVQEVNHHEY